MSTFTLAISCLTTSNLPWFIDLTFQVRMQYCSLQHRTLLPSPVTSSTGYCFYFGSVSSFFMEFLHWSPGACWALTNLGSSSFSVLSFCLFILSQGSQGKNTKVVCHSLLQLLFHVIGSIIGRDPSGVCKFLWITPKNNWSISGSSKIAPHTILGWNGYEISHLSHFTDKQLEGSKQELETIQ